MIGTVSYTKTVFPNGLRVVFRRVPSPLVALSVWVHSGVRHEQDDQNGIAHFFEHMVFKGSERYPGPLLTRQVQALGGTMNAGTSLDTTDYYLVVPRDFWVDAVPLLRELIWESRFDQTEMEQEKQVVFQEMNLEEDEPEEKLVRTLYQTVFEGTPYARSILGTEHTVGALTRSQLLSYRGSSLFPANLVVSVAGDLSEGEALSVIERSFSPTSSIDGSSFFNPFPPLPDRNGAIQHIRMDITMTYGAVGFLCPGIKEDSSFALRLLAGILGDGAASRLNLRLREERGLVDSIQSAYMAYEKAGMFAVHYSFLEGDTEQVDEAIRDEMMRIMNEGLSPEEMSRSINLLKTSFYQAFETALGNSEILGRLDSIDTIDRLYRYLPTLQSLQVSDLQETCGRFLRWDRAVRVTVQPDGAVL